MKMFKQLKPYFSVQKVNVNTINSDYVSMITVFIFFFFMNLCMLLYKYTGVSTVFIVINALILVFATSILLFVRNDLAQCNSSYSWICTLLMGSIATLFANACVVIDTSLFTPMIVGGLFSCITVSIITYLIALKHVKRGIKKENKTTRFWTIGISGSGLIVALVFGVLRLTTPSSDTLALLFITFYIVVFCPIVGYGIIKSLSLGSPFDKK